MSQTDSLSRDQMELLLKRQWELLEGIKQQMFRIPLLSSTFLLALTGYVLSSAKVPQHGSTKLSAILLLPLIASFAAFWELTAFKVYRYRCGNIHHLYALLDLNDNRLWPDGYPGRRDDFHALYYVMAIAPALVGAICVATVILC